MARPACKLALLSAVAINITLLWPLLSCRYNHDDLVSSCGVGIAAERQQTVWGLTLQKIVEWTVLRGRFFPLAFYFFLFFSVVRNLLAYRILGMLCSLGNILLFALLVGRLTQSRRLGLLTALLAPLAFQYRLFHDPIMSFCLLLPLTCMLTLGSFLCLDLYLETKQRWKLFLSLLLYGLTLLMYEVVWPLFIMHCLLIRLRCVPGRAAELPRRAAAAFIAVAAAFVVLTLAVRLVFNVPLLNTNPIQARLPYAPHLDAKSNLENLAKQTMGAIPFSYRWFVLRAESPPAITMPVPVWFILSAGYVAATWLALGGWHSPDPEVPVAPGLRTVGLTGLCLLGTGLLVLPATLISFSAEHFKGVVWGVAYLPVYISYFGATLLVLAGILGLLRPLARAGRLRKVLCHTAAAGLGGLLGAAALMNFRDNAMVVQHFNVVSGAYEREVIQDALRHRLCQDMPNNSRVWLSNRWVWEHPDLSVPFFRTYSGLHVNVVSPDRYRTNHSIAPMGTMEADDGAFQATYGEEEHVYYMNYEAPNPRTGFAVLANLKSIAGSRAGLRTAGGDHVRIYIRVPAKHRHLLVYGRAVACSLGEADAPFILDSSQLRFVSQGRNWCIVELPLGTAEIDLLTLRVSTSL